MEISNYFNVAGFDYSVRRAEADHDSRFQPRSESYQRGRIRVSRDLNGQVTLEFIATEPSGSGDAPCILSVDLLNKDAGTLADIVSAVISARIVGSGSVRPDRPGHMTSSTILWLDTITFRPRPSEADEDPIPRPGLELTFTRDGVGGGPDGCGSPLWLLTEHDGPAIGGDRPGNVVFYLTEKDALDLAARLYAAIPTGDLGEGIHDGS
jgi:hypothetical protein